jgi:hypothetical protein
MKTGHINKKYSLLIKSHEKNLIILLLYFLFSFSLLYKSFVNNMIPSYLDIYGYLYPLMGLVRDQYLKGILPLWNSYMFAGFPLMGSSQSAVFYPVSLIPALLMPLHIAIKLDFVIHYALAGFFTFLYAKKIGMKISVSFAAGLLFAFMGFFMPLFPHFSVLRAGIWFPLIFYFFEDIRDKAEIKSAILAALVIALQIFGGHFQICFYTYLVILVFVIFHFFYLKPEMRLRFLGLSVLSFVLGIIIASPQLYAAMELYSRSVREKLTYEIFSSHAFPLNSVPALLFPFLYDGKPLGYIGQIPIILAIAALTIGWRSNIHIRFWGIVAILALSLAVGDAFRPLNKLMFHFPIYGSFRVPLRHIFEFSFSLSILSAFGASLILHSNEAKKCLSLLVILMITVLSMSLWAIFSTGNFTIFNSGVYIPFISMLFLIPAVLLIMKSGRYQYFKYIFLVTILLEIISFTHIKWINTNVVDNYEADLFGQFKGGIYRVAFLKKDMVSTLALRHGISIVDGYDPLILSEYNSLLDLKGIGYWPNWHFFVQNNMLLSMLNTKYIVLSPEWEIKVTNSPYKLIRKNSSYLIYENMNCMPRASSVSKLIGIDNFEKLKEAIYTFQINPLSQAIVSDKDLKEIGMRDFAEGRVSILDYSHSKILLRTNFSGKGFVVLSDQYYPGWRAFIDGKPLKIYRTNGIMRGIVVPAGVHELVFKYQPQTIYLFIGISMLTLAGIIIWAFRKMK